MLELFENSNLLLRVQFGQISKRNANLADAQISLELLRTLMANLDVQRNRLEIVG